jgi:GxxExxY protein
LAIELRNCGLRVECQIPITVRYAGEPVGDYIADLLVEDRIICELKAANTIASGHEAQLVNYLAATGLDVGLLLNFGRSVMVRRKFREFRNEGRSEPERNPVNPENPVNPV